MAMVYAWADVLIYLNLLLLVGTISCIWFLRKPSKLSKRFFPARKIKKHRQIAFVTSTRSQVVQRIYREFEYILSLNTDIRYSIDIFEGYLLNELTRKHIRSIIKSNYDALVTCDLFTTQIAQAILNSHGSPLPLIFGNIHTSEVHILHHPLRHKNMTGVLTQRNITNELAYLLYLKTTIKHVTLISPAIKLQWIESQKSALMEKLKEQNITIATLCVSKNIDEILPQLKQTDLIIVLENTISGEQFRQLATICTTSGTTLYTSDIDLVAYGAAVGSGGGEDIIGKALAHKIRLITELGTPSAQIPITTHTPSTKIRVNSQVLEKQALALSKNVLFIMQKGHIFSKKANVK